MTTLAANPSLAPSQPSVIEANLGALALRSPRVADALRLVAPHPALRFARTEQDGALTADLDGRALASRRRPLDEARTFTESVDFRQTGAAVVLGFGLGYHIVELARRAGRHSLVIVFEPDLALLRAVLERIDYTESFRTGRILVVTDAADGAALTASLTNLEAIVALGVTILEHAPSRARLGESSGVFAETLTRVVAACRTQVVTTMTQMEVTIRNFLMNVDHYTGLTGAGGVGDLRDRARGLPAIVVSAGPSLERNLRLLEDPGVRERCIIIAVQTVLKPMLSRGIKPHFVTALDYHEISRRFYEGLTPADVEGITLVAEAKANPAILDSFPGRIRLVAAETLDLLLGPDLARGHGSIPPGATVAHLAYSLGRHLGCDPVILIGQDLAFTDGQYYAANAAIHEVWSTELNPFNTLETLEWQRIVRWRGNLHIIKDQLGRDVYTDDQMSTYLAQFERDFLADAERGLTTIDATEGGARKAHTRVMSLADALSRYAPPGNIDNVRNQRASALVSESLPVIPSPNAAPVSARKIRERLETVRNEARAIAHHSRSAIKILERMIEVHSDEKRLNRLIEQVHELRERVQRYRTAYDLVHRLNQAGTFKRFRADRAIELEPSIDPRDRQRRQIERDIANVNWIAEAADSLEDLLSATLASLDGAPKRTRDPVVSAESTQPCDEKTGEDESRALNIRATSPRVAAVLIIDPARSALGLPRSLERTIDGIPIIRRTIERLARCRRLDRVILVTDQSESVSSLLSHLAGISGRRLDHLALDCPLRGESARSIAAARLFAPTCWRGGLGGMTCYDEVFDPRVTAQALERFECTAAIILGPDWCEIDPQITDSIIERHAESPSSLPFVFTQAPPGLAPCLVSLDLARKLSEGRGLGDPTATLGGVLSYKPTRPRRDPIVDSCCVQIPAEVRSIHRRLIADTPSGIDAIEHLHERDDRAWSASSPAHLILELTDARFVPGPASAFVAEESAAGLIVDFARRNPAGVITLGGRGDPLIHPRCADVIRAARAAGIAAVHLRTDLIAEDHVIDLVLSVLPDVVSIDLHASTAETYRLVTGHDCFAQALANTERLLNARTFQGGLPHPWIVPRITRRDAVYGQIEGFYDRALYFAAAGVIDPLTRSFPGERIAPLPKPASLVARDAASRLYVRCDGAAVADETDPNCTESSPAGNVFSEGIGAVWPRLLHRRRDAWIAGGHTHPDLRTLY